jgi:hypothetical protein
MKFLIDECVSRSVLNFLKDDYDAKYVQDIMLCKISDRID